MKNIFSVINSALSQKGNIQIAIGVIVLIIALVVVAYYWSSQTKNNTQIEPQPSSNPVPAKSFLPYSKLPESTSSVETKTFEDKLLNVSLEFPSNYYSQSINADEKNLDASIFFLKERNADQEKSITDVIQCELDSRKFVYGLCRESLLEDVEVSINIPTNIPNFGEDKPSSYGECEKEVITPEKILYSCPTLLSPNPEDLGVTYSLYLLGDNPKVITINVREPSDFADLIKNIVTSAKII